MGRSARFCAPVGNLGHVATRATGSQEFGIERPQRLRSRGLADKYFGAQVLPVGVAGCGVRRFPVADFAGISDAAARTGTGVLDRRGRELRNGWGQSIAVCDRMTTSYMEIAEVGSSRSLSTTPGPMSVCWSGNRSVMYRAVARVS